LFDVDGQMKRGKGGGIDTTKLTVALRNCFVKPPEATMHRFKAVGVTWML
jgi:hypothetical protein